MEEPFDELVPFEVDLVDLELDLDLYVLTFPVFLLLVYPLLEPLLYTFFLETVDVPYLVVLPFEILPPEYLYTVPLPVLLFPVEDLIILYFLEDTIPPFL